MNIKKIVEFHKQDAIGNDDREAKDIRLDIKVVDDRAVHFFKTVDTKDSDLKLNDGATKVIINSKGDFASESAELKELANLMNDKEVSLNEQFIWAQNRVNELNKDRRSDIVSYEAKLMDRELYGRQEGIKKGREEGEAKGKILGAVRTMIRYKVQPDEIRKNIREDYPDFDQSKLDDIITEQKRELGIN